jgi:hypothetical protein
MKSFISSRDEVLSLAGAVKPGDVVIHRLTAVYAGQSVAIAAVAVVSGPLRKVRVGVDGERGPREGRVRFRLRGVDAVHDR